MKKIIITLAVIAATLTMASCNKEQPVSPNDNPTVGKSVITASIENDLTKTTLEGNDDEGYKVFWSKDDKIAIGGNTFTLTEGANTTTGRFQGTLPTEDGTYTACYPADYNGTDWPALQTYTADNITGSPMKASVTVSGGKVSEESLSFKNAGGILRLTLKGTAKVGSIKVSATGLDEITLNCGSGVTLDNTNGTVFHIAMPEGEYSGVSIAVWTIGFDNCTKKLKEGTQLKIERSKITTAKFTASEFKANVPEGALPGKFTINEAGDQVYFSQGNLWYGPATTGATKTFNFEANQYDSTPSSNGDWDASHVSHFFWSKNPSVAYAATYSDSSRSESDVFFTNANDFKVNVDGEDQTDWRTLSKDEWGYLFGMELSSVFYAPKDDHPRAGKFGLATVNSRTGLVLLPDSWNLPSGCSFTATALDGDCNVTDGEGFALNTYTLDQWSLMESAGAVFLPAAGYNDESYIGSVGVEGRYWSSSAYNNNYQAYEVSFISNLVCPDNYDMRYYGRSVRLITECQ